MPSPALPVPPESYNASMLTRKFGREVINYYAGSPLNRVSFLRTNVAFLAAALAHPTARFLLLDNLAPLARDPGCLEWVAREDVTGLLGDGDGDGDVFGEEKAVVGKYDARVTRPVVLFLGLDERGVGDCGWGGRKEDGAEGKGKWEGFVHGEYKGQPYFAVDVTPKGSIEAEAKGLVERMKERGLVWLGGRAAGGLGAGEAAIFAQARALLDWNARNPYCASCGHTTLSVQAGTKRVCPSTDLSLPPPHTRPDCATRHGISNLSFPRTDPTVIMAVLSVDGTKVLLGRQKRWPKDWYSTLAGFLEPGESVEEAVRREVWEESGVTCGRVVIHSSQPWPYPANLMIGAIAQAVPGGEGVHLGHDPELEDARWVGGEELRRALKYGTSGLGDGESMPEGYKEGDLRLPPRTAIANQLLEACVGGFLGGEAKI